MNSTQKSIAQLVATVEAQQSQINIMIDMLAKVTGQESKTASKTAPKTIDSPQKTVAKNTAEFKRVDAMRRGKGVDMTRLAPAMQTGDSIALHSNKGFDAINSACERFGWTVTGKAGSKKSGTRSVTLTHATYGSRTHSMGKFVQGSTDQNWHRTIVKA